MRRACTVALLLAVLAHDPHALAQGDSGAAAKPAGTRLTVQIDDAIAEADRALIREAIARELATTLLDAPEPGVPVLHIARASDGSVALTLRENPAPITRTLPWGTDAAATARDVALMAQNLVFDQTRALLQPEVPPAPATPPEPKLPASLPAPVDTERPPDYIPKPPPPPPPAAIKNRTRVQVMAVYAPDVEAPLTLDGDSYDNDGTAHGVLARFDMPLHARLSAGGGVAIGQWESTLKPESERHVNMRVTATMDATAWLRGFVPLAPRIEVYGLAGVGPSLFTNLTFVDRAGSDRYVRPYVGMNAALVAGTSVRLLDELGVALELAGQYHFLHGRERGGSHTRVHALHLGLMLGAAWSFDAR